MEQLELLSQHPTPRPVDVVVISSGIDRHNECLLTCAILNTNTVLLLWYVLPAMMVQKQTSILNILPNYQETICVGAHNQDGEQCYFSPESDRVDFLALGDNVIGPILKKPGKPWNEPKKGTFYAAPVIGGLICLVLEVVKKTCM